jgi:hypothetical protein
MTFTGFPSTADDPQWPGDWRYGVDFTTTAPPGATLPPPTNRVIAVNVGGSEIKYGLAWIGPIILTAESASLLERWARHMLDRYGGYVHLFPAGGSALRELRATVKEWEETAADDAAWEAEIRDAGRRPSS